MVDAKYNASVEQGAEEIEADESRQANQGI